MWVMQSRSTDATPSAAGMCTYVRTYVRSSISAFPHNPQPPSIIFPLSPHQHIPPPHTYVRTYVSISLLLYTPRVLTVPRGFTFEARQVLIGVGRLRALVPTAPTEGIPQMDPPRAPSQRTATRDPSQQSEPRIAGLPHTREKHTAVEFALLYSVTAVAPPRAHTTQPVGTCVAEL